MKRFFRAFFPCNSRRFSSFHRNFAISSRLVQPCTNRHNRPNK
ncbi:hypothetical protein HMPREF9136_0436 [Prevotella dentalis DSM 3688]|uniref:Uncharacterized protein n=1 Tax=Prevotella dentalis (strain ATCC 49559 / DSM 3688 / JCM 13448 / NCTC 12043 / ES 2772) TaxID=908937 RepID=F9D0Q8_PREDD|nr:hypothetical protein HMPREF9136_0436 [Prevotella dentalis DSM 3688]